MERIVLNAAGQTSKTQAVYYKNAEGFNLSIVGTWSGEITLEGDFGDGEFVAIQTYKENGADFGFLGSSGLILRFQTDSSFAGEARALISQNGMKD